MNTRIYDKNLDNYEKFYHSVFARFRHLDDMVIPNDYKETVDYILKESGMPETWAQAAMRYFGICDCSAPETQRVIGNSLHVSATCIRDRVTNAITACNIYLKIMKMGISKYMEMENTRGLLDAVTKFQDRYQELEARRQQLLNEKQQVIKEMDDLVASFAESYDAYPGTALRIARTKYRPGSVLRAVDMLCGKIPKMEKEEDHGQG